ncbi:MAG: response regulator transcription factor [Firmicutes bacterium]|nr:response regulator transcription factor [Bacillota bacterium]
MSTVLVVDDEKTMVDVIKYSLEKAGYKVLTAYDGQEGLDLAKKHHPDLMVLDIMLPVIDGYEVCKAVSAELSIPIIMLSAKDEEIDRILGLELGADDYLTKPFSPRELVARVKAHLRAEKRRVKPQTCDETCFGELRINFNRREVYRQEEKLELTPKEYELFAWLVNHKDIAIKRETLLEQVWGYDYYGDAKIVNVTVARLREKIERDPSNPVFVITVRGVGYMFQNPL